MKLFEKFKTEKSIDALYLSSGFSPFVLTLSLSLDFLNINIEMIIRLDLNIKKT